MRKHRPAKIVELSLEGLAPTARSEILRLRAERQQCDQIFSFQDRYCRDHQIDQDEYGRRVMAQQAMMQARRFVITTSTSATTNFTMGWR